MNEERDEMYEAHSEQEWQMINVTPEEFCSDCDQPIYQNDGRYRKFGSTVCVACGEKHILINKPRLGGVS